MILVTGASGLVGTHLVRRLSIRGEKVRAMFHSIPGQEAEGVEWVQGDLLDPEYLDSCMDDVSQVYHCAALVSFQPADKKKLQDLNVEGTARVVNACLEHGVRKLVYVSSVAAITQKSGETVSEASRWNESGAATNYGRSKHLAELEVWRGAAEGLQVAIVNPSTILGQGDWTKGSVALFRSAWREFPWYTDGIAGFVDVEDVVSAMILLMDSDIHAERFILSAGELSYRELFTRIATCFGKKPPHRSVTPLIAALVWRTEAIKGFLTGKKPMLTRETADNALSTVHYDNSKILGVLPGFSFTPLDKTIDRVCGELKESYSL